jgi:tRNA(adenine34) deaminase
MHEYYMQMALAQAEAALADDEVPVGAIIVRSDSAEGEVVVGAAHNQRERLRDPTAHAEIIAITQAAVAMRDWRLSGCTLYVTLEPCAMCAGAILQARIDRVVYGAADPKAGAVDSLYELLRDERLNHRVETIGGIFDDRCGAILTQFFVQQRREGKK